MLVSVIIPAYNEEKTVEKLIEKIEKAFKSNKTAGEIIFVDDGSTDKTFVIASNLAKKYKNLRVYSHRTNIGLTKSLMTCFKYAKGDSIVFLPADLESNPEEDIPKLLNKLKEGYDLVCGYRMSRIGMRKFSSMIYNFLSNRLFKITIRDMNWIKAFKREVMLDLDLRSDWHRYIPILASNKGYKIGEVEVNYYKRMYGKSKFGKIRLIKGFLDLILVKLMLSFSERPMFIFGFVSIILFIMGTLLGLYVLYLNLIGIATNRVPLLALLIILIISGILFFIMGFIAELIVQKNKL